MSDLIEVPTIKGNGVILSIRSILRPHALYDKALKELGSAFRLPFRKNNYRYLFSDPKIVEEIFKSSPEIFQAGEANAFFKPFLGDNSLLVLDGEKHLKERRLLMPSLLGERLGVYNPIIESVVKKKIEERLRVSSEVELKDVFTESTMEVILKTVFGAPDGELFDELRTYLLRLRNRTDQIGSLGIFFPFLQVDLGPLTPFRNFKKLQRKIDALIYQLIDLKKNTPRGNDILSILIDSHYEDGSAVEVQTIRDQLLTMLLAGQDTSTHALCWVFRWIGIYPEILNRLVEELNHYSDVEAAANNEYLDWVVKESLRIYPVFLLVGRIVKEDVVVGGKYKVPKGALVSPFIYGVHHREELYPNSFEFIPERFKERRFTPFEYLPFGGGGRRCIGAPFALNQVKITVATILRNYNFKANYVDRPIPLRQGVGLAPKGGVSVTLTRKQFEQNLLQ